MKYRFYILPIIVIAQFFCTSLWFAGNAVMPGLIVKLDLLTSDLGYITSAVQFGFIVGTLVYAMLTIADRFHPSRVFFISACLGAAFNVLIVLDTSFFQLLTFRFLTGFFLAGIYPVGMKIAADYFEKGLGKALGFLVGALVLGTALPHFLASMDFSYDWSGVIYATSGLAVFGGSLILFFVPNGPYRKQGPKLKLKVAMKVFESRPFKAAAFGYFGHMWELYAFWAFVPAMLVFYENLNGAEMDISLLSFLVIGGGAISCVAGGYLSERLGEKKVAASSLFISGICCLLSPVVFFVPQPIFIGFLFIWGLVVIADSPLFSSLVAKNAKSELKGTALTIVTCIGFSITIVSIQLLNFFVDKYPAYSYLILTLGPIFGLVSLGLSPTIKKKASV
ncbi:MFS transporter [Ekhidna sp.]|uniref:MFS transporter n=1 Tax=Ekhidna sp. TaxID=2608089 RepID=UPI003CCB7C2D